VEDFRGLQKLIARIDKKDPAKPNPEFPSGAEALGSTCGAACATSTRSNMNVLIQEYFSNVWIILKPNMDITYEMIAIMMIPTVIVIL
jgi:hypothetical protein